MKLFIKLFFIMLIAAGMSAVIHSCSENPTDEPAASRFITGVIIPIEIEFTPNGEYVVSGKGFAQGDKVFFEDDDNNKLEASVIAVTESSATIIIPASLEDGKQYRIVVYRGTNSQTIGTTRVTVKIIANFVVPAELRVSCGDEITLDGSGFMAGDKIVFSQYIKAVAETKSFTKTGITIVIPTEVDNGKATIMLRRADTDHRLGESSLVLAITLTVIDKPGATIKGVVYSGGRVLAGVSVSDGDLITQTDENGHYWLNSAKRNRLAFVILPSGFAAPLLEGTPQFWAHCKQPASATEQINFALSPVDNEKHTMLTFTDCHLANRNTPLDILQFRSGIMTELEATYNNQSNVIGLNLGDFTWDLYWYDQRYALPEAKKELATLNFPVFLAMGNHDNDPYRVGDFNGEEPWRNVMGPVYYSMNIGKIHYIMLDNAIWTSTGGSQGVVGSRTYSTGIDNNQLEWLKKNLALVDKNTPLIVGFHIPAFAYTGVSGGQYVKGSVVQGMSAVMEELRKFNTVHIVTGHSHISRNITIDYQQGSYERREHNVAAASATWWWTNQYTTPNRINIAPDGTPGGYKVFEIDGENIKWYYKVVGHPREKQFIAFDMNEVKKYWTTNPTALAAFAISGFQNRANDYATIGTNEVLINVWAFEQDFWKINVKEGNTDLAVDAVWLYCPLHTIAYDIPRRVVAEPTGSFLSTSVPHLYRVKASSPTSTLEITVEDRFGNVFKNTMNRPKPLTSALD